MYFSKLNFQYALSGYPPFKSECGWYEANFGGCEPNESQMYFGVRFTPAYLEHCYVWRPANETNQIPMEGHYSTYPGHGFYFDLPLNKTDALILLRDLREWQWMTPETRAIIIEVPVVNPNTNIIVQHPILILLSARFFHYFRGFLP